MMKSLLTAFSTNATSPRVAASSQAFSKAMTSLILATSAGPGAGTPIGAPPTPAGTTLGPAPAGGPAGCCADSEQTTISESRNGSRARIKDLLRICKPNTADWRFPTGHHHHSPIMTRLNGLCLSPATQIGALCLRLAGQLFARHLVRIEDQGRVASAVAGG